MSAASMDIVFIESPPSSKLARALSESMEVSTERIQSMIEGNASIKKRMLFLQKISQQDSNQKQLQVYNHVQDVHRVLVDDFSAYLAQSKGGKKQLIVLDHHLFPFQMKARRVDDEDTVEPYFVVIGRQYSLKELLTFSGLSDSCDKFVEALKVNEDILDRYEMSFVHWGSIPKTELLQVSAELRRSRVFVGVGIENIIYYLEQQILHRK